jgi:hypothetical protein
MADFRIIPSIEQLRQRPAVLALEARFGADATTGALRAAAAAVRSAIAAGDASLLTESAVVAHIESVAAGQLERAFRPSLEAVVNASGVIVHTNLGRAPLAREALAAAAVAGGYANLELDLATGGRGSRQDAVVARPITDRGRASSTRLKWAFGQPVDELPDVRVGRRLRGAPLRLRAFARRYAAERYDCCDQARARDAG